MRLNRTTVILLVVCAAVIVGVLALTSNQASAPDGAAGGPPLVNTAAVVGPILPELTQESVVALAVVDNQTGDQVRLARGADAAWEITQATYATTRAADEGAVLNSLETLLTLEANDKFESDKLADFGLATPAYIITLTAADGTLHTIYVGSTNPAGNRRYLFVTQSEPGVATPEPAPATATPAAESTEDPAATAAPPPPHTARTLDATSGTVFLVVKSTLDRLTGLVAQPPYVPAPTPTITPTATLNPLSQVDMATLTAAPIMSATAFYEQFVATATAMAEAAAAEATPEAGQ